MPASGESQVCFVLMPFGMKKDPTGGPDIDFDLVYHAAIKPAVEAAGLYPVRADEERVGGVIHKPMLERLLIAEFAVADLTTANANVFYELGVRHAARPRTTLPIFATGQNIPFDVNFLRALPYALGEGNRMGDAEATALREALTERLTQVRDLAFAADAPDSPLFQLLDGYGAPDISHTKTDVFRAQVEYAVDVKRQLAEAREGGDAAALAAIEGGLALDVTELGVLVDLMLSYRAVKAWDRMIALYERMPESLKRTVLVREQLGFALNRAGEPRRALEVLEGVVEGHGPSSETCALIGRVYKDLWKAAEGPKARGLLKKAIASYERGFQADWRDAYPGINAVTLLDVRGSERSLARRDELLPVVRFAVKQRLTAEPDYWDHATLLELAVLEGEAGAAEDHLDDALAAQREVWEPETTANNLKMIRDARHARGVEQPWLDEIIEALDEAASG